jgi:SAM-dependent methyltransferase
MKVPDSGMPDENFWKSLFDVPLIVEWLELKNISGPLVEVGCGYGTFTVPLAQTTGETIYAFDIEPSMIEFTQRHAEQADVHNIRLIQRDIVEHGSGLQANSAGMVLLFNILHFDERRIMLEEASRILRPSGIVAIIHWRKDIETPRGPDPRLRPDEQMILDSISGLDLLYHGNSKILEPFHWGIQLVKGKKDSSCSQHAW